MMSDSAGKQLPLVGKAVDESLAPKLGMMFENDEKAYHFYCLYGNEMGFGVRKQLVKRRSSGDVYCRVFCCYKEGFCRTIRPGKKPRHDARTGCQAHLTVRSLDNGQFQVTEFEPEHNHELVQKTASTVADATCSFSSAAFPPGVGVMNAGKETLAACRLPLKNFVPSKFLNAAQAGSAAARHVHKWLHGNGANDSPTAANNVPIELCEPMIDMEFEDGEQAYQFYVNYAEATGFSVRKHLIKRRASGVVYSRMFVCHKEGFRRKRDDEGGRRPKPYDRTGCLASMTIRITKNGRYRVAEFERKHNHPLIIPSKAHLVRWRWRKRPVSTLASLVDLEEDLKAVQEHNDASADGKDVVSAHPTFVPVGFKKYIHSKHANAMRLGDLGALLQYFNEKQVADPSFYYSLQLDRDDRVTNVFWTDAKSIVDFQYFGDVLCFDTTYRTRQYNRPFAPFLGVNHHKQAIVFASALLYDETEESFKWLFETLKTAMCGKQPKAILTDRFATISNVIATVWPETSHRFCVWQIYNDAAKHLNSVFQGSTTFTKDFSRCLYDYEDEEGFLVAWKKMIEHYDLQTNDWLAKLYQDREKWALACGRDTFCADMKSTLIKESVTGMLKEYMDQDLDFLALIKHYDRIVDERWQAEVQADFHVHHSVIQFPSSRMLKQAANLYTPSVFKVFQTEFELSMDCMVYKVGQTGTVFEYKVTTDNTKEYFVKFDSENCSITCSCKKFQFIGIQCRHVLKTLDILNIKELPPQYILKRWTKDAKVMNLREGIHATDGDSGIASARSRRYNSLCMIFNKVAVRAAESVGSYELIEKMSERLMSQVHQILQKRPPEACNIN